MTERMKSVIPVERGVGRGGFGRTEVSREASGSFAADTFIFISHERTPTGDGNTFL